LGTPIIADELESLTRQNPAFDNAEAYFYIAYKNDEIVGRITAIVTGAKLMTNKKRKVRLAGLMLLMTSKSLKHFRKSI
jgi:hypothetical protein